VSSIAYPNPATGLPATVPYNYTYDGMERPTGISFTSNGNTVYPVSNVLYGPSDELLQWNHGTFETFQYNSMLQLTKEVDNLYSNGYQYVYSATQNNGRITQRIGYGETVSYTYDSLNRLSAASSTAGWGTGYAYDGFGNLTDKNVTAGSAPSLHVTISPTTNQIQCCQGTYDSNGNLLGANNGSLSGYQYDAENRITAVLNLNTGNDLYGYDPSNLRVYKKEPSGKEWMFFYGVGGELLATYFWVGTTWQGSNLRAVVEEFVGRQVRAPERVRYRDGRRHPTRGGPYGKCSHES